MNKTLKNIIILGLLGSTATIFTQCGRNARLYRASDLEQKILDTYAFDVQPQDTEWTYSQLWDGSDVNLDLGDSYIPSNISKEDSANFQWVTRCNRLEKSHQALEARDEVIKSIVEDDDVRKYDDFKTTYDIEKAYVQKLALERMLEIKNGKNLPVLIPVEYSLSTGDKHDHISYMAYKRSILREDYEGESLIETSNRTYVVNGERAKKEFLVGKMQYFSVVEVKGVKASSHANYADFSQGQPFSSWHAYNMHKIGSGLSTISDYKEILDKKQKDVPVARLYIADVRQDILPIDNKIQVMYPDVASVGRNNEVQRRLKDIFNLREIFRNRQIITASLSSKRIVTKKGFTGNYLPYQGAAQVLQRMNCDVGTSRIISARYTPIVLDLGEKHLRTTSEYWGAFFNLANGSFLKNKDILSNVKDESTYNHRTAWIGGKMQKIKNPIQNGKDVSVHKEYIWQRVADDGFLILPPKENQEVTSVHLFGSEFVNPQALKEKYNDGFEALQSYAGTTAACNSPVQEMYYQDEPSKEQIEIRHKEIQERYLGPWNKAYSELKIWVDKNINGFADPGEIQGLKESGVVAINTCINPTKRVNENDQFGNNTSLRSAFLYDKSNEFSKEEDILNMLTFGKTSNIKDATFRIVVDVFFKARPYHFLERSLEYRESVSSNKDEYSIKINETIYTGEKEDEQELEQETSTPIKPQMVNLNQQIKFKKAKVNAVIVN